MDLLSSKRVAPRAPELPFDEAAAAHERGGRIEELVRLIEARVREVPRSEAAALLNRAGDHAKNRLRNPERAELFYRRALAAGGDDRPALLGLKAIYEQRGDAAALAEVLERLGVALGGLEGAGVLQRAAELYEGKLRRMDRAILCSQLAAKANPKDRSLGRRVRALLSAEARVQAVFDSLERERLQGGFTDLATEYVGLAEALLEDPTEHELATRSAQIAKALGSAQADATLKALDKFQQTWRDRVRVLRTQSMEDRDRRRAARLSLSVAKLFAWFDGGLSSKLKEALDRSFLLWPAMPEGLAFLEKLGHRLGDFGPVLEVLEKLAADTKDPSAKAEVLVRIGTLKLTHRQDRAGALAALQKAVAADPARADAASLAAELLLEEKNAPEAVNLLERHLATVKDRPAQLSLRLRLGELCLKELKDPKSAGAHFFAALKLDGACPTAAFEVARRRIEAESLEGMEALLDVAVDAPKRLRERVTLLEAAAALYEEKGQHPQAFAVLSRALALDPARADLLASALDQARKASAQPKLAELLKRAATGLEPATAVPVWRTLAQLLETDLSRPDDARIAWQEVLKLAPADAKAAAAVQGLPAASEAVVPSAWVQERSVDSIRGELDSMESSRATPERKIPLYRELLQSSPDDPSLLARLGLALIQTSAWEEAAKVYERWDAVDANGPDRFLRRRQLARLYAERLGRKDDAAKLLLELLSQGQREPEVTGLLERLAAEGVRKAEVQKALGTALEQGADRGAEVASLRSQLASAATREEQKHLLVRLAQVHEQGLADLRAGFDYLLQAIALDPLDAALRAEALRVARDLNIQTELASSLVAAATDVGPDIGFQLLQSAAQAYEEGGLLAEAAAAYERALALFPNQQACLLKLADLFKRLGQLPKAVSLLRSRLPASPSPEGSQLLVALCALEKESGQWAQAAASLHEAIALGAPEGEHLPRLAELYERAGKTTELSAVLKRQIELADAEGDHDRTSRLSLRRAQVLEAALGNRSEAVKNYSQLLGQNPSNPDAVAALEHLLEDPGCREDAARALIPAYEKNKEHRKLVGALDVVAESTPDSLEKVLALKQAAHVHLHLLRQPELAFATLARAMKLAPQDSSLRAAARSAAEDADAMDSYAEVLAELLTQRPEPPVQVALYRDLADVQEKRLNDKKGAVASLRAVLALAPTQEDALRALHRLYRAAESWSELAEVLEKLAQGVRDPAERMVFLREVAMLHEQRLNDREKAAAAWRRIAEVDPLSNEAATALDRLSTELQRWPDLALALELRCKQEGQSPQARELAFRLAQLRQEKLNDTPGALKLLKQILAEDPSHLGAREFLDELARGTGPDSIAAIEILDPLLAQAGDHARRVALREARMQGALREEKIQLGKEIRALYEIKLKQPNLAFMSALKLFAEGLDRHTLANELERLAKLTGSYEELAEIYENAGSDPNDGDAPSYLRRAAELREHLAQPEDAIQLWQALLKLAPQDRQALERLSQLYEHSKNAKNLSEVYSKQAQLTQDPAQKRALLLKSAGAYESAGEDEKAVEALRTARAISKDRDVLEALDRLYGKLRRPNEQADILTQLAGVIQGEERKAVLLRRATLLEKEADPTVALKAFAELLADSPNDPNAVAGLERLMAKDAVRAEAARLLEPAYRSVNDQKRLVELLDVRVLTAAPEEVRPLVNEIATLREALGQKPLAFAARMRSFHENPEDAAAREQLERLAADTGGFEELAGAYEDQLDRGVSPALATELWRRLSVLYSDRINRPELAVRPLEELSKREPKNPAVLDSLARIHRKTNAFRELAGVMKRQVMLEPVLANQLTLLFELARLAEETLADKALAAQCYGEVLRRKPDDANAIKALSKVLTDSERWPELATLIGKEIQLAEGAKRNEEALDLMVRLGRLKLTRLSDPRGALDLFQAVLQRKAGHAGAVGALEEMARSDSALRGEAAAVVEPIFASGGDHLKLVQMLESQASAEPKPADRAALLRKVANLYAGPMKNPEMAFVAAARAMREVPDDLSSLELCSQLSGPAGAEDELVALLEETAAKAAEEKARAAIYRTLAQLQERSGESAPALESWKRVLAINPSDTDALGAIGRLYADQHKPQELLEVLQRQLTLSQEPAAQVELLLQIAHLQAEGLHDGMAGLATLRRLLELAPEDARALERMDALCQKQERWPELADVLAKRISLAAQPDPELKLRLAAVRETRLMDKVGALELYAEVVKADPKHAAALSRLEVLVEKDPSNASAVAALLGAYREANNRKKLAELLESRVAASPDSAERKTLLVELGAIQEAEDEPELSFLSLWKAFKEDPNDAPLRVRLEKAADAADTHDELASVYEECLPRIAEASDAARVCLTLGRLFETKLQEPEKAIVAYEKARSLSPQTAPAALMALDRLYSASDQAENLAKVLEELAALTAEPKDKVALLFRLGQTTQEKLKDPARAAQAYEALLQVDKAHLASARVLEQLYEAAGQEDKLYAMLKLQRDLAQGAERERVLVRMAKVSAESLSDVQQSIDLYKELLSKNPRNEEAFNALDLALEKSGQHAELEALLKKRLASTLDPRELVKLNDRLGTVTFRLLGTPEEALPYFKAALDRDARHRHALECLRDIHEKLGKKDELVAVLRRLIPVQEDAEGVKQLRIRLAELLAELGRREEALDAARRALEVVPQTTADLARVEKIFLALKAWADAVRTLEMKAELCLETEDREQAIATFFEIIDIWRTSAGKPDAAGPVILRILEVDPAHRQAYEKGLELYTQNNDWRAYDALVERYLPNLVTDEEKIAALRDLAKIREQRLGQKDAAFLALCRALELSPAADAIREEVERLTEETGSYEELATVYEHVADELPRGPLAERLYRVLARIQDQKLDDATGAEASLRKILEFDPTNAQALESLAEMFERRGKAREHVVALEQKLEAAGSIENRKVILRQIARVYDEKLKNVDEAAQTLLRALELEPDAETLNELATLYRREKRWPELINTLLRARDLAGTPAERARIQNEVGQLHERELTDDEAAVQAFLTTLELDPTDRESLASLERLYTKLDRPSELLNVYERQLHLSDDDREKVTVLFRSATIWEDKFHNAANADACVDGVLALDPNNLQAIKTLIRLRREQNRFEELIPVLERQLQLAPEPAEQAQLYVEIGEVYRTNLRQIDKAVNSFNQALQVDPTSTGAANALGLLYEKTGNWPFALEMLQREAQMATDPKKAAELYHRMGKINQEMLMDAGSAKGCFLEALNLEPTYVPSIQALKGIYEAEQDWESFEKALMQEAQYTEEPAAKSQALLAVAEYFSQKKEDTDTALTFYEDAVRLVPDLLEAARPLADLYIAREKWEDGARMLEVVVRRMRERGAAEPQGGHEKELCRQLYRLGYVAEKLGNKEKALGCYEEAYRLDATYLPALEGLGNLLVQHKRYDEALKVFQTILIHHREDLTDLEIVEVYWQIGEVHNALQQHDRAQNHYEKALSIDPGHEPSLRALIGLADNAGKFDKAAQYRQKLIQVLDDEPKYQLCLELGNLAREKLREPHMAIDAYLGAHKIHPEDLEVMDRLYVLYRETRQPQKAAEILDKMLSVKELLADVDRAKRVWFALGEIARDELGELERAADAFNQALDLDPRFVDAFSALEAMLGSNKKWPQLEENYARMIQRLPKTDETHAARMALWKALGELYLNVLQQSEQALMAYQVVAAGLPEDAAVQEIYANLAAQLPGNEEKALAAYRRAMVSTANPGKVLSALAALAAKLKDYDAAFMSAQTVASLIGETGAAEKEIIAKLTPYAKKREVAQRALNDRQWQDQLIHPKARGPLAELLAVLFEQVGQLYGAPHSQHQVNPKKHRIDLSSAQEYQIHHYRYVARLFGMDAVELYSPYLIATRERLAKRTSEPVPDPLVGIEICHTHPVCLKVGGKFFGEPGQKEAYAMLGKSLAYLRPELALALRLPPERLRAVFQAALALAGAHYRYTVPPQALQAERHQLEKHLPAPAKAALARLAQECVRRGDPRDLENYVEGAELTSVRAALFAAGEVEAVKKVLHGEGAAGQRVPQRTKLRELMVFAVSEELHALRKAVGINVEVAARR